MQDLRSKLKRLIERLQSAREEALTVRGFSGKGLHSLSSEDRGLTEAEERINHIVETVQRVEEELQEVFEEALETKGKVLH